MSKQSRKEYHEEIGKENAGKGIPERWPRELSGNEVLHVGSELSAYEEAIAHNNKIKQRMDESAKAIDNGACKIVDAMCNAYDLKKESVDKIRDWRKVIEYEYKAIADASHMLFSVVTQDKINELNDLCDAIERLGKLSESSAFKALFK